MKEPKRSKLAAKTSASEIMRLFTAALHAADEMGLDSVAIVREQLQDEGILPKDKDDNS